MVLNFVVTLASEIVAAWNAMGRWVSKVAAAGLATSVGVTSFPRKSNAAFTSPRTGSVNCTFPMQPRRGRRREFTAASFSC